MIRQPPHVAAVGVHNVQVDHRGRIDLEQCRFPFAEFTRVRFAVRREHDLLPVRAVTRFGVVTPRVGQSGQLPRLQVLRVKLEVLVVVPRVPFLFPRRPKLQLRFLFRNRFLVFVRAREQHPITLGMDPCASRLPLAGRDAFDVAGIQVHQIDLIERVGRVPFALKHHLASVAAEIALAGAASFERQLTRVR